MHRRRFAGGVACAAAAYVAVLGRAAAADAIAGDVRRLTDPGGGDNRATFLPDGRGLLFASRRTGTSQIWTIRPNGSDARRLHASTSNDHGRVAPSPDGSRLCFSSDRGGENAVYVLDLGSGAVSLVSDPAWWSFGPSWSQRGLIAYFSRKGGNRLNTWTARPDGSGAHQVTDRPGESRQPWWSPDGTTLALSADGGTGTFQVWLSAADGSGARAITAGAGDWQQPFWSPDGRRIAVSAKPEGARHFQILVLDLDRSGARAIQQPDVADNVHPAWSPDGRNIVFTSGTADAAALWWFAFA